MMISIKALSQLILFSSLLIFSTFALASEKKAVHKTTCPGVDYRQLQCLRNNFSELYQEDYKRFFSILRSGEKRALKCKNSTDTAAFLAVGPVIKGNSETQEYFAEVIEKLAVRNTQCLLKGILSSSSETKTAITNSLKTPIFVDRVKIMEALLPFESKTEYKAFVDELKKNN